MKSIKLLRQIGVTRDTYYSNNQDIIYLNFIYKDIEYQVFIKDIERHYTNVKSVTYISFSVDKDSDLKIPSEIKSLFLNSKHSKSKGDKIFISAQVDMNDVAKFIDEYVTEYELKIAPSSYFNSIS